MAGHDAMPHNVPAEDAHRLTMGLTRAVCPETIAVPSMTIDRITSEPAVAVPIGTRVEAAPWTWTRTASSARVTRSGIARSSGQLVGLPRPRAGPVAVRQRRVIVEVGLPCRPV